MWWTSLLPSLGLLLHLRSGWLLFRGNHKYEGNISINSFSGTWFQQSYKICFLNIFLKRGNTVFGQTHEKFRRHYALWIQKAQLLSGLGPWLVGTAAFLAQMYHCQSLWTWWDWYGLVMQQWLAKVLCYSNEHTVLFAASLSVIFAFISVFFF